MFDEVLTTNPQVVWALRLGGLAQVCSPTAKRTLAALDLCIEDLVVESLRRAGLEEDPRAALLDDLVILRRDRGDRNLERALRHRPEG